MEDILLGGVVKRFNRGIETKKLRRISDISEEDIRMVDRNMTKCSRYVHDEAAAIDGPVPSPDEIQADIAALEEWADSIKRRWK